ncbi:hypothetical protein [Micromonospora sp. NPDC047730]|uniref:hypothetical protein n=1 Tax=Micromonospora sp. NPDC047730 TaxID=3364253 RepID=UPI00371E0A91
MRKPTYDDLMTARGDRIDPEGVFDILRDLQRTAAAAEAEEEPEDLDLLDRIESVKALIEGLNGTGLGAAYIADHRCTLIAADYFEEFARDEVEDTSGIHRDHPVLSHVNWADFADALRQDYKPVTVELGEFAGTWWVRG